MRANSIVRLCAALSLGVAIPALAQERPDPALAAAAEEAQQQLQQTFTNLTIEDFGESPVKGPIYQASAGGRIIYYAPESEHLLFAAVYDRNGLNVTALAQDAAARRKLATIDTGKAFVLGPANAPSVIEFTDPDCPYCRALDRFWAAKAAEGKPVRRLIFFVSGIHPEAAAKAEHILCSPDRQAAFKAIYGGAAPDVLRTCPEGAAKVRADAEVVGKIGISGTPTIIADGKLISGFQQAELETFLSERKASRDARP
ncbi:DsbC family protein [Sandaracinobacter sp. RS1-74]|uniref:DsbC family protein n=1 Tax=Sandaracinobacteroides sayramensis TaxID=2913411 RepID=UPI001EDC66E7|nr:DsbC family protein [Sandaracinobacteroides sayramensis]MCG2841321.1 DsbC family protein [Sandaracinobacteroides sayramensis]